ncbi:MAG: hypothetical protein R6V58_05985 [Planctomycetota bacterium]
MYRTRRSGSGRSPLPAILVALAVAAALVVVVYTFRIGRSWQAATVLPADTLAYAWFGDADDVCRDLERRGVFEELSARFEQAGDKQAGETVRQCGRAVRRVRSIHVSLHAPGGEEVSKGGGFRRLVVLDVGRPTPFDEFLPAGVVRYFNYTDEYAGTRIFTLSREASAALGSPLYGASSKGKIVFSTEGSLLAGVLNGLATGKRAESLAASKNYRPFVRNGGRGAVGGYFVVQPLLSRRPRFARLARPLGLADVYVAFVRTRYGGRRGRCRVVAGSDHPLHLVAETPSQPKHITRYLPRDTAAFAAMSFENGRLAWRVLNPQVADVFEAVSGPAGAEAYEERVKELESILDAELDELAGLVEEVGAFLVGEGPERELGVFVRVSEPKRVYTILRGLEGHAKWWGRSEIYERRGVRVHVLARRHAWAMIRSGVVVGRPELVDKLIDSAASGETIHKREAFRTVDRMLPKRNGIYAWLSPAVAQQALGALLPASETARQEFADVSVALALTARDDVIHVDWACSRPLNLGRLLGESAIQALAAAVTRERERLYPQPGRD